MKTIYLIIFYGLLSCSCRPYSNHFEKKQVVPVFTEKGESFVGGNFTINDSYNQININAGNAWGNKTASFVNTSFYYSDDEFANYNLFEIEAATGIFNKFNQNFVFENYWGISIASTNFHHKNCDSNTSISESNQPFMNYTYKGMVDNYQINYYKIFNQSSITFVENKKISFGMSMKLSLLHYYNIKLDDLNFDNNAGDYAVHFKPLIDSPTNISLEPNIFARFGGRKLKYEVSMNSILSNNDALRDENRGAFNVGILYCFNMKNQK